MAEPTQQDTAAEEIETFPLRIITPQREIFNQAVREVAATAEIGNMQLLPRHEPLLTPLKIGLVTALDERGEEVTLAVHGGFLEMNGQQATIYADSAEQATEIDADRAAESERRAKDRLAQVSGKTAQEVIDTDRARFALMRAMVRQQAASALAAK